MKLRRFPKEKQEQVEQLVVYAQLMGLSGDDLVAIGGKLARQEASERKIGNMKIIESFDCLPIGGDTRDHLDSRFKLKTAGGSYNFTNGGWSNWHILSLRTKVKKTVYVMPLNYDLPKVHYLTRERYSLLLGIAEGKIVLDF